MTRSQLARQVAERTGMSMTEAAAAVKAVLAAVAWALGRDETVRLAGFGSLAPKDRPARTGRHPRTGEPLDLPASRAVAFRPAKPLRDAVNGRPVNGRSGGSGGKPGGNPGGKTGGKPGPGNDRSGGSGG